MPKDHKESQRKEAIKYLRDHDLLLFKSDKRNASVICRRDQFVDRMESILRDHKRFKRQGEMVDWNDRAFHGRLLSLVRELQSLKQ